MHDAVPLPGVENGVEMKVTVSVDPQAGEIEVDLRDNLDCLPCGLNLTESTSRHLGADRRLQQHRRVVPRNAGSFGAR